MKTSNTFESISLAIHNKAIAQARLEEREKFETQKTLLCLKCQKEVAIYNGTIEGITTWFSVCSDCLGYTNKELLGGEGND